MTKAQRKANLIMLLEGLHSWDDIEMAHSKADDLLIEYINDEDIAKAYEDVPKWYA